MHMEYDNLPPTTDVSEKAARVLTEALFKRSPYLSVDQNDAAKSALYTYLLNLGIPALAAAGLLTGQDKITNGHLLRA